MDRLIMLSCTVLLLSGLAASQVNGQATEISGYATTGVYSMPIVPLVTTPSLTLGSTSLQTGSSDASMNDNDGGTTNSAFRSERFDFGAARSQDSFGAAELKSWSHPRKAARLYTNQDVAQVNDTNGLVKFGNKTEHL
jgi:hypothetical protein